MISTQAKPGRGGSRTKAGPGPSGSGLSVMLLFAGVVLLSAFQTRAQPAAPAATAEQAETSGFHADWPLGNLAARAKVIPLSIEGRLVGGVAYDTGLLRIAAVWLGGEAQPRRWTQPPLSAPNGTQIMGTRLRPGAADPAQRDPETGWEWPTGAAAATLPNAWGAWLGPMAAGVVRYRVGGVEVVETPAFKEADGLTFFTRTLEAGAGQVIRLRVAEREGALATVDEDGGRAVIRRRPDERALAAGGARVLVDRRADQWGLLEMGGPMTGDAGERPATDGRTPTWGFTPGESWPLGASEAPARALAARLHDGDAAGSTQDTLRVVEFPQAGARIVVDLGRSIELRQVDSYACGDATGARQAYTLYGHSGHASPSWGARDPVAAGWERITQVDTDNGAQAQPGITGVSVQPATGPTLGLYRRLLWVFAQPGVRLTEIDILDGASPPKRQPAEPARGEVTLIVLQRSGSAPVGSRPALQSLARNGVQLVIPAGAGRQSLTLVHWVGPATELLRAEAAISRLTKP